MKYILLDTNFILSCIRKKIDFFEQIKFMGLKLIIPKEVIEELKNISESGKKKFEEEAKIALKILTKNSFEKISLNAKIVDNGIVKIAKENPRYIIATLDKEIQNKIENQKLILRGNKELEIV